MAKASRKRSKGKTSKSGYNRSYYVANRVKILRYMRKRYRAKRASILRYAKKYRQLTKGKPFYQRGNKARGKRPLYGRLPRVHQYRRIGGKSPTGSKTTTGRKRRGLGSNSSTGGRRPMGSGTSKAFKSRKKK